MTEDEVPFDNSQPVTERMLDLARLKRLEGDFAAAYELFLVVAKEQPNLAIKAWREAVGGGNTALDDKIRELARQTDPSPEFFIESELFVPWIFTSDEDMEFWQRRIYAALARLHAMNLRIHDPDRIAYIYWFGAFHILDNEHTLAFRSSLSGLLLKICPELEYTLPCVSTRLSNPLPDRMRLGILIRRSDKFNSMAFTDLLDKLDRSKFRIILFRPNYDHYEQHKQYIDPLDAQADEVFLYHRENWRSHKAPMEKAQLDILIHEELGALSYLGFSRVAPVQCSFYDPCVSYGTPQKDYSILYGDPKRSSALQKRYHEKIAWLGNFPHWNKYEPDITPDQVFLSDLNIPESSRFFFSYHGLLRWRVEDDIIPAELLRRNPDAWLVIVANPEQLVAVIMRRWRKSMPDVINRVRVIPFQPLEMLLGLIKRADVLLAPPGDAGGPSSIAAFYQGKPFVTFYSPDIFQRTCGFLAYKAIAMEDLVAASLQEYITIADRLLNDVEWRREKEREVQEKFPGIYNTGRYVEELEKFLWDAFQRARSGQTPMHWANGRFFE